MSDLFLPSTRLIPQKGDDPFLSPEEVAFQQRMMRNVQSFPQEFWTAVLQKVALDGEPVPQSQIQGLARLSVTPAASIATTEATSTTTYTDLATSGPELTGLRDGLYILMYGAGTDASSNTLYMSPSINGSTPTDGNAVISTISSTLTTSRVITLQNDNNNTVLMKYRVSGGTGDWGNRWLTAIRYGNA